MNHIVTVESAATECRVLMRDGALHLSGPELTTGAVTTVVFGRESGGVLPIRIGDAGYSLTTLTTDVVPGPAEHPTYGVTTLAAAFATPAGHGTMAIVVNCGHEPPLLSITATHRVTGPRSWEWAIDHAIQHSLLDHLPL